MIRLKIISPVHQFQMDITSFAISFIIECYEEQDSKSPTASDFLSTETIAKYFETAMVAMNTNVALLDSIMHTIDWDEVIRSVCKYVSDMCDDECGSCGSSD